jgi:hypothetical protein
MIRRFTGKLIDAKRQQTIAAARNRYKNANWHVLLDRNILPAPQAARDH